MGGGGERTNANTHIHTFPMSTIFYRARFSSDVVWNTFSEVYHCIWTADPVKLTLIIVIDKLNDAMHLLAND